MKKIILLFICVAWVNSLLAQEFITKWDLTYSGTSSTSISFGVGTAGIVNYTWETVPLSTTGSGTFSGSLATISGLPVGATVRLKIAPTNFNRIKINNGLDKSRLIDVEQWGTVTWSSMDSAFFGCNHLNITSTDIPDISLVSSMNGMFINCSILNGPANINSWNTTSVTDMFALFANAILFNQDISNWNTANVTTMDSMFFNSRVFNQAIGNWNTNNVTIMSRMFLGDTSFNQPIGNWNTSNVTDMSEMFSGAKSFNHPIGNWNTGNVTDMNSMFKYTSSFNQPIGNWNTANVTDMSSMFYFAVSFNQAIGNWNTGNVANMNEMFSRAKSFNQPIGTWNTTNVLSMSHMFLDASKFNQPIGNWNTANVTTMLSMFSGDTSFNQPIGIWNTGNVIWMNGMFSRDTSFNQYIGNWNTGNVSSMQAMFGDATSFNQPIGNWNTGNVISMQSMFAGDAPFNQPIGNWNTSNVTDMMYMFDGATSFNQPIGTWNTANVIHMHKMFNAAISFNQPIGSWNTFNVHTMSEMFHNATSFNQPLGSWNTASAVYMNEMFHNATSFNQPIGTWNTASVVVMGSLFYGANSFNQTLGTWNLNPNATMTSMLDSCGMNCINYSSTLHGWATNASIPSGRNLGAQTMHFGTNVVADRNYLINTKGWTITGDAGSGGVCCFSHSEDTISQTVCSSFLFNGQTLTTSGSYNDTLINSTGCDSILTLHLVVNTIDTTISQTANTISSNVSGATYQWIHCENNSIIPGATNQSYTPLQGGSYAVIVSLNGCTDTSTCAIFHSVGLDDYSVNDFCSISPNPSYGNFTIETFRATETSIKIYNLTGQVVYESQSPKFTTTHKVDISSQASGVYFVEVKQRDRCNRMKVVKD